MKWLILVLLALVFVAPAFADETGRISATNVVATDHFGRPIINTFFQLVGHNPNVIYGPNVSVWSEPTAEDTVDIAVDSGGMPAWWFMQIPEETGLEMFWIRQKESVSGPTHSYTWGDWCPVYVGETYREFASNAGLWESIEVVFAGAAYGSLRVYYRMELISDD